MLPTDTHPDTHERDWVTTGILLLAGIVRFWGIAFGLPPTWARPDEEALVLPAIRMLQGHLNPHWFQYPSLYMYALAPLYAVDRLYERLRHAALPSDPMSVYILHTRGFHIIDRWLSASLGVLSVYVLYRIARLYFPRRTAQIAALFLALTPLHALDSHFGVADVAATCMILMATYAAIRWQAAPSRRGLIIAAACCGLAASTKYNGAIVIVTIGVMLLMQAVDDRRARWTLPANVLLVSVVAALAFLAGTPYSILDRKEFLEGIRDVGHHLSAGHGYYVGVGWTYHLRATLRYGLGLPLLAASLLGAVWLAVEQPRIAVVVLGFPLAYYAAIGPTETVFFRYALPIFPFLCLTAAYLISRLPAAAAIPLAVLLIAPAAVDVVRMDRVLSRTDNRALAADWIRDHVPTGSSIYQSGHPYGQVQLPPGYEFIRWPEAPDLVVVQTSPLFYSGDDPALLALLAARYDLAADFHAYDPAQAGRNVYDPLDAFFVPLRGLHGVDRPGLNIGIYRRRGTGK